MGYNNLRHYHGGLQDWKEAGGPLEPGLVPIEPSPERVRPARRDSQYLTLTGLTARVQSFQFADRLANFVDRQSTARLFMVWLGLTLCFGLLYWLAGLDHHSGLIENGRWLDGSWHGLVSAIYFSFVTVTSVGYGDVVPRGLARSAAIIEAIAGLLIFGAVIAKFVSRRQDEVVREIHRVTFEERLDRIQTNLYMLLSELQTIAMMYTEGVAPLERIDARLDSAALVFAAELRTVHHLLYRPREAPEEPVLEGILATLASALNALSECLLSRPVHDGSEVLDQSLRVLSGMAGEICATCVPIVYAPELTVWMDRIHDLADRIAKH